MTNKSTKKALALSIISLVVCVSMLVGTTFAWFTDSVTSANNKIIAGNLKVDLEVLTETATDTYEWVSVKNSKAPIFDYDLWEPGYTEVKVLKVENEGTLALKWKATFSSANELGILADVIDVYVKEDVTAYPADRADLSGWTKVGTVRDFVNTLESTTTGTLLAKTSETLGIALKMQETAGNEYQDETLGAFDITILATQLASEKDSFDEKYDVFADYDGEISTPAALVDALKKGGTYKLVADITLDEGDIAVIPAGTVVNLDLDNKTITGGMQAGSTTKHVYPIENRGTLTLAGNGVVNGRGVANYGTLTIEDGTYNAIDDNGGAPVWNYAGSDVTVNGGTFVTADDTTAPGPTAMNIASGATAVINGGKFVGAADQTYGIINDGTLTINDIEISADHGVVSNSGTLKINGGKFTQNGNLVQTSSLIYTTAGTATINGGEFIFNKDGKLDSGLPVYCAGGSVAISGGYFGGNIVTEMISSWGGAGTASVTGGTFAKKPGYIATEHIAVENADGTWSVVSIEGKTYVAEGLYVGNDKDYSVYSAAGFTSLNGTIASNVKSVTLEADIDMNGGSWTPVKMHQDWNGMLTNFDGKGHTISNMVINGQAMFTVYTVAGDTVMKDVTFDNITVNSSSLNSAIIAVQVYTDILLDNVDVVDSTVKGNYKVASLIGSVYNENSSVTATLKNCDVKNCEIIGNLDFMITGFIAFVYESDDDYAVFENCTISDTTIKYSSSGYGALAYVYCNDGSAAGSFNEVNGVTVANCAIERV